MRDAARDLGHNLARNGWVLAALIGLVLVGSEAWSRWSTAREADRPFTDWLIYSAVQFVEADEDQGVLQMESTYTYLRRVDRIVWSDRLRCQGPSTGDDVPPREWPIWSTQEESASGYLPSPQGELVTRPWTFTGTSGPAVTRPGIPTDDRPCIMESVIVIENDGSTDEMVVESPPFRPGDDE